MKIKKIDKVNKYIEYTLIKIKQFFTQKKFKNNDTVIKYIFEKNKDSNELIIVFSACTRPGVNARYNYIKTLKNVKVNKLFILDDFGIDKRGGYYLGKYPDFELEKTIKEFIDVKIEKNKYKKLFFIGSSKGGYAALNFGLLYEKANIIVGAPQYFLGKFLFAPANEITRKSMNIRTIEEKRLIDERLEKRIVNNKNKNQKIYLHYSSKEHTYDDHIFDLIRVLKDNNYYLVEEVGEYTNHGDVSYFYPKFLIKSLKNEGVM